MFVVRLAFGLLALFAVLALTPGAAPPWPGNSPESALALIDHSSDWKGVVLTSGSPANDGSGNPWFHPAYDDSSWPTTTLPVGESGIPPTDIGYFRFDFSLTNVPSSLLMWFSSDDGIQLYVNGTSIGSWGQLDETATIGGCVNKPDFCTAPQHVILDPQDIASGLTTGTNTIAAKVVNANAGTGRSFFNVEFVAGPGNPFDAPTDPNFPAPRSTDPVNLATGSFVHQNTDISIPTSGLPLNFTRCYNSGSPIARSLGNAWSLSYDFYLEFDAADVDVFYPEGHAVRFVEDAGNLVPRAGVYDTLEEAAGVYTLTTKLQVEHVFNSGGVLQSSADRNGNTLSLSYTSGRLTSVTDEESVPTRSLTIAYKAGTDLIETVTGPLGRIVTFSYDANDDLTVVTDVKGGGTTYTYGTGGMETLEDANGNVQVTNTYDSAGRVVEQDDAVLGTTCIYYGITPYTFSVACPELSTPITGPLVKVKDQRGDFTTYDFDDLLRTASDENADAGVVAYTYDNNHNVTCITDELGRKTAFSYDSSGNLTQLIDADNTDSFCALAAGGTSSRMTYTAANVIEQIIDPGGSVTDYIYDGSNNLTRVAQRAFKITSSDSDGDNFADSRESYLGTDEFEECNLTTAINDEDDFWPLDMNDDKLISNFDLVPFIEWLNTPVGPPPDAPARLDFNEDAFINIFDVGFYTGMLNLRCPVPDLLTCFERDTAGRVTAIVESTNLQIPMTPTGACFGNKTVFAYDAEGDLASVTNPRFSGPGTPKTTFDIDDGGRVLSVTNELSHTATATYDAHNNVLTAADNLGNTSANTYDAKGNLTSVTDANREAVGAAESGAECGTAGTGDGVDDDSDTFADDGCPSSVLTYDDGDRLLKVAEAWVDDLGLAPVITYAYDENGNLLSVMDANHQPDNNPEDPADCMNGLDDDPADDANDVPDDGCPSTVYVYDSLNRLTLETDALGRDTSYEYDAASQLTQRTDARGLVTKYFPDDLGRLDLLEHWNVTLIDSVDYTYDAAGNRTQMVDDTGTTNYGYDSLSRITCLGSAAIATPCPSGNTAYEYDNVGARSKITYPDGNAVAYAYDVANNLKTVTDWLSNVTSYTYDDAGNLTKTTLPNLVWSDFSYDTADRLTSVFNEKTGETLSDFTYTLDAVGNRTQMVDSGTNTYQYDELYRLTDVTYPGPTTDTYTYDAVGNRLTLNTDDYTYDAANQLTDLEGLSYVYDDNGNQTSRGSDTFTYDHENRLSQTVLGGVTSSSTYNGDGVRMSHTVGPTTTDYEWDVARRLPVILDDGTNTYVYGLDLIAAIDGAGVETFFTYDGLGSTADLTDDTATVTDTYSYDVFGDASHDSGSSDNDWLFTGEQEDGSEDLYYLRARYYDPATGRFLSQDPLGIGNGYSYVKNNPVRYVDPSGLCHQTLGYDQPCRLIHDIKEGGFRPPWSPTPSPTPTATPPATPGTLVPEPAATPVAPPGYVPRPPGDPFFGISCCRDLFKVWTGKGINHWLGCWAAELEWFNALLLDATLAVVSGEPLPLYYQLPSAAETTKKYAEAQKTCDG